MTTKTIRVYTEEDKKLLNTPLPLNPCDKCNLGGGCCGCPDVRKYEEAVAPYRAARVYSDALLITELDKLGDRINNLVREYNRMRNELPEFVERPLLEVNRIDET